MSLFEYWTFDSRKTFHCRSRSILFILLGDIVFEIADLFSRNYVIDTRLCACTSSLYREVMPGWWPDKALVTSWPLLYKFMHCTSKVDLERITSTIAATLSLQRLLLINNKECTAVVTETAHLVFRYNHQDIFSQIAISVWFSFYCLVQNYSRSLCKCLQ
jgi:hypothetical protein